MQLRFNVLILENYHGCEIMLFGNIYTCYEREMVLSGCPRIATRDPATAILNSKTLSATNSPAGERSSARKAGACGYRRVLVLFFACQETEAASNIVET